MCKRVIVTCAVLVVVGFVILLLLFIVGTVWGAPAVPTTQAYLPLVLAGYSAPCQLTVNDYIVYGAPGPYPVGHELVFHFDIVNDCDQTVYFDAFGVLVEPSGFFHKSFTYFSLAPGQNIVWYDKLVIWAPGTYNLRLVLEQDGGLEYLSDPVVVIIDDSLPGDPLGRVVCPLGADVYTGPRAGKYQKLGTIPDDEVFSIIGRLEDGYSWWVIPRPEAPSDIGWVERDCIQATDAQDVPEYPVPPVAPEGRVTCPSIDVRTGPGSKYPIITTLFDGAVFDIVGKSSSDKFWVLYVHDSPTNVGWVVSGGGQVLAMNAYNVVPDYPIPPP